MRLSDVFSGMCFWHINLGKMLLKRMSQNENHLPCLKFKGRRCDWTSEVICIIILFYFTDFRGHNVQMLIRNHITARHPLQFCIKSKQNVKNPNTTCANNSHCVSSPTMAQTECFPFALLGFRGENPVFISIL